jgi:hypothetical protein
VGTAFVYLGLRMAEHWRELENTTWNPRWLWVAASVPAALPWFLIRARMWQLSAGILERPVPYAAALRVWTLSELGRYLPGKFWQIVGRTVLAREIGLRASTALVGSIYELGLTAAAACLLFLAGGFDRSGWLGVPAAVLGAAMLLLLLLVPGIIPAGANLVLRRFGRAPLDQRLGSGAVLVLLLWSFAAWAAFGGALWLLVAGLLPGERPGFFELLGGFTGAWIAGMVAVFAPAGLGVREGVLANLLPIPPGPAVVMALATRLWISIAEVLVAAAVLLAAVPRGGRRSREAGPGPPRG